MAGFEEVFLIEAIRAVSRRLSQYAFENIHLEHAPFLLFAQVREAIWLSSIFGKFCDSWDYLYSCFYLVCSLMMPFYILFYF